MRPATGAQQVATQEVEKFEDRSVGRRDLEEGFEILSERRLVVEGEPVRVGLEEKVKRVEHRHLGHEVDLDPQLRHRVREGQPGVPVRERVLLPVDKVNAPVDAQRMAQDAGLAVWGRTQPDDVGPMRDRLLVAVMGEVVEGNVYGHGVVRRLNAPRCSGCADSMWACGMRRKCRRSPSRPG